MENYWFGKSEKEVKESLDEVCIEMYGMKHKDLPKPMPDWSDDKLRAYQKLTRRFK